MNYPERRFGGRKQMNITFQHKKFTRGGSLAAMAISAMLMVGSSTGANAWHYGRAHGSGILPGLIVGGAIGGAIIGGVVTGLATQASRPAPPPPRPYYPPAPVYSCGLVCGIQSSLIKLGYNPGPVDGAYGQRTADAISAFEYNNQLPVTGQATPQIYNYMKQLGG
jgi:hypothetical protein